MHFRCRRFVPLLLIFALGACRKKSEDVREWTPADHDHTEEPTAGQVEPSKAGPPSLSRFGINDVVMATWTTNCVSCHGKIGRGDGPQGRMMKPPDFTNPKWQRVALDSEMKHTIKNGRGRMPAFGHFPDETVEGLIKLIRLLNSDRAAAAQAAQPAGSGSAEAPAASAEAPTPPQQTAPPAAPTAPAPAKPAPTATTLSSPSGAASPRGE